MKYLNILPLICVVVLAGFSGGCSDGDNKPAEPDKPDYITVVVKTTGAVTAYDEEGHIHVYENLTVKVDIIKAGGRTITFQEQTSGIGLFQGPDAVFKLYREQPIECGGDVIDGADDLPYVYARTTKTLTWDQVDAAADFGDTYTWPVHLIIVGSL